MAQTESATIEMPQTESATTEMPQTESNNTRLPATGEMLIAQKAYFKYQIDFEPVSVELRNYVHGSLVGKRTMWDVIGYAHRRLREVQAEMDELIAHLLSRGITDKEIAQMRSNCEREGNQPKHVCDYEWVEQAGLQELALQTRLAMWKRRSMWYSMVNLRQMGRMHEAILKVQERGHTFEVYDGPTDHTAYNQWDLTGPNKNDPDYEASYAEWIALYPSGGGLRGGRGGGRGGRRGRGNGEYGGRGNGGGQAGRGNGNGNEHNNRGRGMNGHWRGGGANGGERGGHGNGGGERTGRMNAPRRGTAAQSRGRGRGGA